MKKVLFSIILLLMTSAFSNVYAQRETPPGAGDKNLNDNDIKMRSVELDRIKQEAAKNEAASFAPINTKLSAKFPQIKEDFEGIQLLQDAIIKAYTTGKTIDYRVIATSADQISVKAKRLDANIFADTKKDKEEKTETKQPEKLKPIADLIVELDNTIGSFVSSKIFGNINVIEPEAAIKTRTDLLNIIKLSEKLSAEAKNMK
ncbi:MAG: hypothetical protein JSS81_13365 [Acidobacteria bacterium]|nr:hypothetical protein [Acidobacteriota bacterium]